MPVSDFTALLTSTDVPLRWNMAADLATPVVISYSFYAEDGLPSFEDVPPFEPGPDNLYATMNDYTRDAIRAAIAEFEQNAAVHFVEIDDSSVADMRFLSNLDGGGYSWADFPIAYESARNQVDVVMSVSPEFDSALDWQPGEFMFRLALHEIGHAMGLAHPHEGILLEPALDNNNYTVMSYDTSYDGPYSRPDLGPFDVEALQYLYGAPNLASERLGARVRWDAETSRMRIPGDTDANWLLAVGADSILEGFAGNDTLSGAQGDDLLAGGEGDDLINGGAGSDTLHGDAGNDTLNGGNGDDDLSGTYGRNLLQGGSGDDTLRSSSASVTSEGGDQGNAGGGSPGIQTLNLDDFGHDTLQGGAGDDLFLLTVPNGIVPTYIDSLSADGTHFNGGFCQDTLQVGLGVSFSDLTLDSAASIETLQVQVLRGDPRGNSFILTGLSNYSGSGPLRAEMRGGDDMYTGASFAESVTGGQGNDTLNGGDGNDTLEGEAGNDSLSGQGGDDVLIGGQGDDHLLGGDGNDTLYGQDGFSLERNDPMTANNDTLDGGAGDDLFVLNQPRYSGQVVYRGGTGFDTLDLQYIADTFIHSLILDEAASVDQIRGYNLNGTGGDDHFDLSGVSTINDLRPDDGFGTFLGGGNDLFQGSRLGDQASGEEGSDTLYGGQGNDSLYGGGDADSLFGNEGDDLLFGGLGEDYLVGGSGNDTLIGGQYGRGDEPQENDTMMGGDGDDTFRIDSRFFGTGTVIDGGAGTDVFQIWHNGEHRFNRLILDESTSIEVMIVGSGSHLTATEGDDTIDVSGVSEFDYAFDVHSQQGLNALLFSGNDQFTGSIRADTVEGMAGDDTLNTGLGDDQLFGGEGGDLLNGGDGADRLDGNEGADVLNGDGGMDHLQGGDGDDTLNGGAGNDTLTGDAGQDRFVLAMGGGQDIVTDFEFGTDQVDVSNLSTAEREAVVIHGLNDGRIGRVYELSDGTTLTLSGIPRSFDASGTVTITGDLVQNAHLTAQVSDLADPDGLTDPSLSYTWFSDGVAIEGSVTDSYQLAQSDVGTQISVQVRFTDDAHFTETLISAATAPVANLNDAPHNQPIINGDLRQGQLLSVDTTVIRDADGLGPFTIEWLRDGTPIAEATSAQYLLTQTDVGSTVSVRVYYTDGFGTQETLSQSATGTVQNTNDAPTGLVHLRGTAQQGQTLTADPSELRDFDGLGSFAFQWLRNGQEIEDATEQSFALTAADIGAPISVRIRYTDGQGTVETVTSSASTPVETASVTLLGDAGDNSLTAGLFNDTLWGLAGNDTLIGLSGDDALHGGDGTDRLIGGEGNDTLIGGTSETDLRDVVFGGDGNDSAQGGYGNDELRGDAGNDTLEGGFGADTVIGGTGNDLLTGSAWGDVIFGGDGMDFINGGFGFDRVNGGAGADRFFHIGVAGHGSDWIQDYNAAEGDVLQFGGTATRSQFQVNFTETPDAGVAGIHEAFIIFRPTGQILWALVDGRAQSEINVQIGGETFDLLV